jgi:Flp pilus assembly pilin Flp
MGSILGMWLSSSKRSEEGQAISEYAILVALIVLIVVTTVHVIGMNAQHVIERVNDALHHVD